MFYRAHAILRRDLGEEHPQTVDVRTNMAVVWRDQGRLREAEELDRKTLTERRSLRGDYHPAVDNGLTALAATLALEGRYAEARPLAERGLAMRRAIHGGDHRSVAESLALLARIQLATGQAATAESTAREAIAVWERVVDPGHPTGALLRTLLAATLRVQGRLEPAGELLARALADVRAELRRGHPAIADVLVELGQLELARAPARAADPLREAFEIRRAGLGPNHWRTAQAESLFGAALVARGETDQGERLAREGWTGLRATLGGSHPETEAAEARLPRAGSPRP